MLNIQWFMWNWLYLCRLRIIDEEAHIDLHRSRIATELISLFPKPKTQTAYSANGCILHHSLCLSVG